VREEAAAGLGTRRMTAGEPELLIAEREADVERCGGAAAANEGRLLRARTYRDQGRAVEAEEVASTISEAPDRPVGLAARTLLAAAQEASGDAETALATWETLGETARFAFQRREALASAARILASLGRLEEAETIFAAIAEEAAGEDPVEAGVYRLRLGELKARRAGSG